MGRRRLPNPTRRKGSLTWEVRCRLSGRIVTRSLGTRDYDEALKRVPRVYGQLLREHDQANIPKDATVAPPALVSSAVSVPSAPRISIEQACQRYREHKLANERQFRTEYAAGGIGNPVELAASYEARLRGALERARAQAIVHDFSYQRWFLTWLSKKGIGEVDDFEGAQMALARTLVATYREILENDACLSPTPLVQEAAPKPSKSTVPSPLNLVEDFITERGDRMTAAVAADHRAVVRDLCLVAGDKSASQYTRDDARKFKEVLLALPANWMKRKGLRELKIVDAARKAKEQALPRQSAKTIQLKRAMLNRIFEYAKANYEGAVNPFEDKGAWVVADASAADQKDAFTDAELSTLLASDLPGELHWLTWLSLCTGARLNELCQLTTEHVRLAGTKHFYFGPDLRLKTARRTDSSIRSVPMHPKLETLSFVEFVKPCETNICKRLFPDLAKHRSGRYSDAPSKAFRRHLIALGIKRSGLSFHSLRHTFAAEFRRVAPQDIETRERLMGHHVPGVAGRYGSSYESEANDLVLLMERAKVIARLQS
jgi:integrase